MEKPYNTANIIDSPVRSTYIGKEIKPGKKILMRRYINDPSTAIF